MTMTEQKRLTEDEWFAIPLERRHEIEKAALMQHLDMAGLKAAIALLDRIEAGQMHGDQDSVYDLDDGEDCGCVIAVLSAATKDEVGYSELRNGMEYLTPLSRGMSFEDDPESPRGWATPVETLIDPIRPGDTPGNTEQLRLLRDWTAEWIEANS